ncbi:hemerythrin domain-containing protein [Marinobacterium jannaschii]|uniref:hemerythrin domain-containing protein n=1 Tax=Marinobacterium jannaschii TaxID=64970 RepID=UPI000480DA69|nr:hemerythrin domain-containing protein [Marinobacterium jannaschii]
MTILNELHQDHINLNKLLVILRHKVEKLRSGEHPNFGLMGDVVEYISTYADAYHHPREDRMYEYLRGRSDNLDLAIDDCIAQHRHLKKLGEELCESVDSILHDAVMPMDEFTDKLAAFVEEQSTHLNFEEGSLFPLVQGVATENDWATLNNDLPSVEDPLFGEKQAARYAELYQELLVDFNND